MKQMTIILNNTSESFDTDCMTVTEMLKIKNYTYRLRVIKINGNFIPRDNYDKALIRDGDTVQMHYLMSGG
jgi:thiamine biosynthesis protein ThiS